MAKKTKQRPQRSRKRRPPPAPEYTVLARRYRPQQFADLVGQEAVAQALVNAIESNRVAHAYLFTGARGVGKTSAARILAKALNCVKGPTATPCDQCEICQAVTSGDDTDVIEIDGARTAASTRSARSGPKRAISAHPIAHTDLHHRRSPHADDLSVQRPAQDAGGAAGPCEVHLRHHAKCRASPITIPSRCQRFDFCGISIPRILDRLKEIVVAEKMEAEDEALETIARRAWRLDARCAIAARSTPCVQRQEVDRRYGPSTARHRHLKSASRRLPMRCWRRMPRRCSIF